MSIADNVRQRRTALGMTQAELASKIRVHRRAPDRSYVSRLEAGKTDPSLSVVRSLAKALGCRPWQLVAEVYDSVEWWNEYLGLAGRHKREIQRLVKYYSERRGS